MQSPINPAELQAEAFPVLTVAQIDRIRPYGVRRRLRPERSCTEPGQQGIACFVVLSGKMDILMTRLLGEQVFVTLGVGGSWRDGLDIRSPLSLARSCRRAGRIS